MDLGKWQYYKQQKGYSYARLSTLSGVPEGTIRKIFQGETKSPRWETIEAIERILLNDVATSTYAGIEPEVSMVRESALNYGTTSGGYTLEDYYALPDERRVELIDGVFYDMSSPMIVHQLAAVTLVRQIGDYIDKKKGSCIPFVAPVDVQLDCDNKTMVQPDVMIVCDKNKLTKRCVMGAPDFIVEILSPSTKKKDAFIKLAKYQQAGVREYWMVDLEQQRVVVYFFEDDVIPAIYGFDVEIPVRIYDGELRIDMRLVAVDLTKAKW